MDISRKKIVLHVKTAPSGHNENNPFQESSTPAWVYDEGARYYVSSKGWEGKDYANRYKQYIPLSWIKVSEMYEHFCDDAGTTLRWSSGY